MILASRQYNICTGKLKKANSQRSTHKGKLIKANSLRQTRQGKLTKALTKANSQRQTHKGNLTKVNSQGMLESWRKGASHKIKSFYNIRSCFFVSNASKT